MTLRGLSPLEIWLSQPAAQSCVGSHQFVVLRFLLSHDGTICLFIHITAQAEPIRLALSKTGVYQSACAYR